MNPQRTKELFFNKCDDNLAEEAMKLLQNEPLCPFLDAINISEERFGQVKKLYIECLSDNAVLPEDQKRMYGKLFCNIVSLDSDHFPSLSNPKGLADILLSKL